MESKEITILILASFAAILIMCSGFVFILLVHRNRKVKYKTEKDLMQQQFEKQLLQTQLEMQTQTMQEIGREIHDNVGQKLTLASLYTQQLDFDNQYPGISERVNSISAIINASLQELRTLSKSLTNDAFASTSLKGLLEEELQKVNKLFTINVDMEEVPVQNLSVKTILVRILQEFIQNTIKYANASTLDIRLSKEVEGIQLSLKDNGIGFDPQKMDTQGIGLENMKKRIALVGGSFQLQSQNQMGTRVEVFIPNEKI